MILIHTSASRSASTWMEAMLLALCEQLGLRCEARGSEAYLERLAERGFEDGTVHPAVFLPWHELALERCPHPYRVFHVRRDPRDLLVSQYFALRYSHVSNPLVESMRPTLAALGAEEGLVFLAQHERHRRNVEVLLGNLGRGRRDGCLTVEFEDLVTRPRRHLSRMLRLAGFRLSDRRLRVLIRARSFEKFSEGRERGQEDVHHHYRKGVTGGWREYFSPRLTAVYKDHLGKALVELGYERNLDW